MLFRYPTGLIAALALAGGAALAQETIDESLARAGAGDRTTATMQRFVIERDIPGAGQMTPQQLSEAAAKSNTVLRMLGPDIQWVHSYVTGDRLYCVYNARSADVIREHAAKSGFPANRITPVTAVIDPTTAN